jgi:hypothetical protein
MFDRSNAVDWALAYARHGLAVFPCAANKHPLTPTGFKDASCDPAVIGAWWQLWPHAEPAWALPETVVVVDIDIKHGKNGYRDFEGMSGYVPHDIETPTTSTPSGGAQLFYSATKLYPNRVAIKGTGIDTRSLGGYVVLPGPGNGRQRLKPLRGAQMAEVPAWLDEVLRETSQPPNLLRPVASHKDAVRALKLACAKIIAAPCGRQDDERHRQCFLIGALIARGDLDYAAACAALVAAARGMPAYGKPWRDVEDRVEASIARGMGRAAA